MQLRPANIMALSDGCLALFDTPYTMNDEGEVAFTYQPDGLLLGYDGLEIHIPTSYLDHMFNVSGPGESGVMEAGLHIFSRSEGEYEAVFAGTLTIEAEIFLKAKGVAEYLSATPQQ